MTTNNVYRQNAQECLRIAQTVENTREKSFWVTLAQSWLRLAEEAAAKPPSAGTEGLSVEDRTC